MCGSSTLVVLGEAQGHLGTTSHRDCKENDNYCTTSVTRFGEISPKCDSILNVNRNCLRVYILFGKMLNLLWKFFNAIGHIDIVKNGSVWTN